MIGPVKKFIPAKIPETTKHISVKTITLFILCFHYLTPPKGLFLVSLSMYGVNIFINKIAKETPSG